MVVTITSLNDAMLQAIFAKCTFKSLNEARKVCKKWNLLVTRTQRDQKYLKLLVVRGDIKHDEYTEEVVNMFYPTEESQAQLIRTKDGVRGLDMFNLKKYFHRISHLSIHWVYAGDVSTLIRQWSTYLTSLTLTTFPNHADVMMPTWEAIGQMPFLRSLHLLNLPNSLELPVDVLTNVLGQLESFKLVGYKKNIKSLLFKLGADYLKHLHLDFISCTMYDVFDVIGNNPDFGKNLVHFTFGQIVPPEGALSNESDKQNCLEVLGAFANKLFSNLATLDILCASEVKILFNCFYICN